MDPSITEYLERLDARLDAYTNANRSLAEKVGAHVVSTPAIVHNPPPATSSESTTGTSAPVPDVSCCTTKAREIPTVAHDASLVCIAMVPVTCSTECSTQVDTIDNVDEVRDATTAVHLEHTVDPITIPVPAVAFQPALDTTAHVTNGLRSDPDDTNAELTHTVTPTEISPELASLEVCGARHGVVTININIRTASAFTGSPVWPSSNSDTSESSPPSTHKDTQEVLELLPGLFDKPEAALDDDVKEHKDDAKLSVITFVLNSPIWYEHFSPRDPCFVLLDAQRVIEEHTRSEPRLTWPPLVGINSSELCSSGQFDSDSTLSLFPWNPGGYLLKPRNPMTMMLITASSGSHWHVTGVIEESDLCDFGVMWYRDHGSLRIKQWWLDTQCLLLVNAIFAAFFWHEGHIFGNSVQDLTTCSQFHLFLSGVTSLFCMETGAASCLWDISDYLERFVACCCIIVARDIPTLRQPIMHFMGNLYLSDLEGQSTICFVQPSCQFHAQNTKQMFIFSPKNVQSKLQYFACDCRAVRVWSELLRIELSDKFWNLSEHHILEHADVCSVPMGVKLQWKIQLISLSVHRKILSQEDCKCVLLMLLSNEEAPTSSVIQPVNSLFNGFASSWSMIPLAHEFSYMMSSATTVKWVAKFGAVLLGKLPCISFYLPSATPKHPWPFPVAAMYTQQLLFPMKTITGFVTIPKIYSRLFEAGIAHLLGSKSASARHLEQSWDPGASDKTLSVQVSDPWEGISHCRIKFHDSQHMVDSMQFSSGCKQEHFQGGNGPGFVPSSQLQAPAILMVKIISKGAPAMSGVTFSTGYNQECFQEGRGIIVVTAVFPLGFFDNGYYLSFDHDGVDNGYVLDGNSIHHNCCFNLMDVYSNFDYH